MTSFAVIVALIDPAKIQLADQVQDKIDQMIIRKPIFHIRRQQKQLVRLIRLKACVILHQGVIPSPQKNVTTTYSKTEFSDRLQV